MDKKSYQEKYSKVFLGMFFTIFLTINIAFYHFLNMPFQIWMFLYVCLLEFTTFGFAYEITQITLSLFLKEIRLPFIEKIENYPQVALICTTCDDVNPDILKNLNRQTYPNLHIFILDDSQNRGSQLAVDSLNFRVLRRHNRIGYKAGNLNNWLFRFGQSFPYFIVADADSILPDDFVKQMVSYAEHPSNSDVAIFETLIKLWNHNNKFASLLGTMVPIIHRYKLRLDNRFCTTLSVGHNNLYRTSIIIKLGGFEENYLAEDYATSIELLRKNYRCMTVPVTSYERLPENLQEFVKRQSRWTVQTFQLMSLKISDLSWMLKLNILMTLHYYLMPMVALFGITLFVFLNIEYRLFNPLLLTDFTSVEMAIKDKTLIFWITYLLLMIFFRGILAWSERISLRKYWNNTLFQSALFAASLWPILQRLFAFWDKNRLRFNVTGWEPCPSLKKIILLNIPGFILIWIASLSILFNPIWSGLNLFWAVPASISPFLINSIQRRG